MADFIRNFSKKIQQTDYGRSPRDIFSDFLTLASTSFANVFEKNDDFEKEYIDTISKYKNKSSFPEMLYMIAAELEKEPFQDLLGKFYMHENLGNSNAGQFFTPFHVSDMMAQITCCSDEIKKKFKIPDTLKLQSLVSAPEVL